ncbi:MAG: LapA family protein [Nitrospirae bacterium]|nr:LapA family protein [Nitrospirota bacterium]
MDIKKFILPAISLLFVFIVFLDENNTPVPVKIILGSPLHMSLSVIIIGSILFGAGCAFAGLFLVKKMREKPKRNGKQD